MTAGLQVWGDHGFIQLDETNRGMCLVKHGDCADPTSGYSAQNVTYTGVAGRPPIVAVRSTGPAVAASVSGGVNGVWNIGFYVSGTLGPGRPGNISPGQAHYYVYDWPDTVPAANFGMQIFNSQGALCFDAARPYMRVVNKGTAFQWVMPTSGVLQASPYEPTGKKYAVWINDWAIATETAGGYPTGYQGMVTIYMKCGGTAISGNSLIAGECYYSSSGGSLNSSFFCNGHYMILDVTGHDQF